MTGDECSDDAPPPLATARRRLRVALRNAPPSPCAYRSTLPSASVTHRGGAQLHLAEHRRQNHRQGPLCRFRPVGADALPRIPKGDGAYALRRHPRLARRQGRGASVTARYDAQKGGRPHGLLQRQPPFTYAEGTSSQHWRIIFAWKSSRTRHFQAVRPIPLTTSDRQTFIIIIQITLNSHRYG